MAPPTAASGIEDAVVRVSRDLSGLFHRLNNQLGIILANAELLEARAPDDQSRARAAQVVASAIEAMASARELRARIEKDER